MNIDFLVLAPHPDDAEICCGGLLLKAADAGLRTVVIDLTAGEMGTRGTKESRFLESAAATRLMNLAARENLGLPDSGLTDGHELRAAMVTVLRKYRPKTVLAPHWEDQHPDHQATGLAAIHACYLAGVPKYLPETAAGVATADRLPYRPSRILHYNNRYGIDADLTVDISSVMERKIELVRCYATQFGSGPATGDGTEPATGQAFSQMPQTRLSRANFFDWMRGFHAFYGYQSGCEYGEAYCIKNPLRITTPQALCD